MLTDTALRNLKPKPKTYKAFDRDGMYVTVSPVGTVTFRYDYCLNGRRETLTIGRYGPAGISLVNPPGPGGFSPSSAAARASASLKASSWKAPICSASAWLTSAHIRLTWAGL